MDKKRKLRKYFYIISLIVVVSAILNFILMDYNIYLDSINLFKIKNTQITLGYFIMSIAFSVSAWLLILGIIFVPKNWKVWVICFVFLILHAIFIIISIGYGDGFFEILRKYIWILSFGLIRI